MRRQQDLIVGLMFFSVWAGFVIGFARAMLRPDTSAGSSDGVPGPLPLDVGWVMAGAGAAVVLGILLLVLLAREEKRPDAPSVFE